MNKNENIIINISKNNKKLQISAISDGHGPSD